MALYTAQAEQKNVVVNPDTNTVFFESNALAYNYKTGQWTVITASSGKRFFAVQEAEKILGTIETSGTSIMVQDSNQTAASAATATFITGEFELNAGGRAIINGARPITDGASVSSVQIGVRDLVSDTVSWSTGSALNSRTGQSNFRGGDNTPEGRYHRAKFVFTGGFTTVSGADFDFTPTGRV